MKKNKMTTQPEQPFVQIANRPEAEQVPLVSRLLTGFDRL
jgi:hypothetical protein